MLSVGCKALSQVLSVYDGTDGSQGLPDCSPQTRGHLADALAESLEDSDQPGARGPGQLALSKPLGPYRAYGK